MKNEYMYRMVVRDEKLQRISKTAYTAGDRIEYIAERLAELIPDAKKNPDLLELEDIGTRLKVYAQEYE